MVRKLISFLAIGALLFQFGCGGDALASELNLIISTTSAVVDIVEPQYAAQLNPYFTSLTTFVDEVTTELATTDTAIQRATKIAADAAAIAKPDLTGLPATIAARVEAIAPLVADLVTSVQSLKSAIDSTPGGANAFFAAHKVKPPSAKTLAKIKAANAALKAKLKH